VPGAVSLGTKWQGCEADPDGGLHVTPSVLGIASSALSNSLIIYYEMLSLPDLPEGRACPQSDCNAFRTWNHVRRNRTRTEGKRNKENDRKKDEKKLTRKMREVNRNVEGEKQNTRWREREKEEKREEKYRRKKDEEKKKSIGGRRWRRLPSTFRKPLCGTVTSCW
jgi:hypothetical protein